jgi:uncharacterized OB-fold protein
MSAAAKPKPTPNSDSLPFWEGCKAGELRLQHCVDCGEFQFYPRMFCISCGGSDLEWKVAGGRGRLVSITVIQRPPSAAFAEDAPYGIGLVELEEGVQMMAGLIDCDLEALECDVSVRLADMKVEDDLYLPRFSPEV